MNYEDNYTRAVSLAERLKEAQMQKPRRGFAERLQESEQIEQDFTVTIAKYIDSVRGMLQRDVPTQEERASEIGAYLQSGEDVPTPKRNPNYWQDAPFLAEMSVPETDDNVRAILEALKSKESSGDYNAKNKKSSASGGYQMIDSTWRSLTKKYGVGTEYKTAKEAPPEVQDVVAGNYVREILLDNNNDVTKVPLVWYTGNAKGQMSEEALAANDGLTAQQYQNDWMRRYNKMLGNQ